MSKALELNCVKYGYNFIENSNIQSDNLWEDDLHLDNSGKGNLLNNFLISFNKNYLIKQTSYLININSISSERGKPVICRQGCFIEHNYILHAKLDLEKITVGHVNINSVRNNFDALSFIIDSSIDILFISDTKLMIHFRQP